MHEFSLEDQLVADWYAEAQVLVASERTVHGDRLWYITDSASNVDRLVSY